MPSQAAKTAGLAGTIAIAKKTAEIATEKTAAMALFPFSELANMVFFLSSKCLFASNWMIPLVALHSA